MKKVLFFLAAMLMGIGTTWADDFTGLLVTTPSGKTTYALSEMPKIVYAEEGTAAVAQLFTSNREAPVATIQLQAGESLRTEWGTFIPTGINGVTADKATTFVKNGRKYVTGGKLIIISKDGKLYDASGKPL